MKSPYIFVVDDERMNVETMEAILQHKHYQVHGETDSRRALEAILAQPPDLVLTDVLMPHLDGYDLCRALKAKPETARVPVIFLSALDNPQDRVLAFEAGGVDYIAKPYHMREVLARVETHLQLYQQQREIETLYARDQEHIETLRAEIVRRVNAESELEEALERISRLNRLLSATNSLSQLNDVMDVICRELSRAYDKATVNLTVFHQGEMLVASHTGNDDAVNFRTLPMIDRDTNPIIHEAMTTPVLRLQTPLPAEKTTAFSELTGHQPEGDQLLIPLLFSGNLLGIATINTPVRGTQTLLVDSAREIAGVITQTVTNCLLFTEVTLQNHELEHVIEERTDQLERLNTRMASILASVSDAIVLLRSDGTIATTNRGFDQLFGYAPDERFGEHISNLVAPESQQAVLDAFDSVSQGGRSEPIEIVARHKNGTLIDIDMSLREIRHGDDEDHIVCSCHDITSLKETQRMKDNFVSMVTHELRTPLTGISLIANSLVTYFERMTDEQRYDRLVKLREQSRIMNDLVESVLDISRLEARTPPERTPIDVVATGREVVEQHEPLAAQKSLTMTFAGPDEPLMLLGTQEEIRRMWRNLISNAIKYTPANGTIQVMADQITVAPHEPGGTPQELAAYYGVPGLNGLAPGRYALGQVTDNGHGISEKDQAKLFTRFYRGWAKKSSIPGTGLGLALVQELLTNYGGGIDVKSKLDEGTTFTFWLPLEGEKVAKETPDTAWEGTLQ